MNPLADRIRPTSLREFVGQEHLTGKDMPIRQMVERRDPFSIIFWGPPGVGKTTLAKIIATESGADFVYLSAVAAGKADVRRVVEAAREKSNHPQPLLIKEGSDSLPLHKGELEGVVSKKTVLFLDEIHRFNKAQQDYLLPYVEDGTLILIGATTENPSFSVISPLLSRCQVYVLEELTLKELKRIVDQGMRELKIKLVPKAVEYLLAFANGDARKALNTLEQVAKLKRSDLLRGRTSKAVGLNELIDTLQTKFIRYDKKGDEHYDTISAFIKSMRASNPDAAVYYLARMVEAGEDPLFIARRMVIFASEDIGMAQPTALVVANEVFRACETIGYPECAINLAHGAVYLAKAKKDRAAYDALRSAQADVQSFGNLPVPKNLRNAPTKLMKELGYGEGYERYTDKDLLPGRLRGKRYLK